ncbi:NAD binding domain of 6-phosphogluconate dehydrogenase-domain-containing protein [Tribonema minus]|uniref:3-hydroxyisobutyrate dehydrogenase n=1 Tax=Tribonema minus TaxID=303371 RepID=A0A835YMW9_9STRA|nr:NAD binding domain of 6-phosphogluconate dehydrogenase-domain-containing protein [Tribonema minus]
MRAIRGALRGSPWRTASSSLGGSLRGVASAGYLGPVGFIGLGNMGSNMAANLIKAGHTVLVHDAQPEKAEALVAAHPTARAAAALEDIARECGAIVTMLPNTAHVEMVHGRLLCAARRGALLIDSSTIAPAASAALAARAAAAGVDMVDAPVSGGVPAAAAGTLTFIVGGTQPAFERAVPLLNAMGSRALLCGSAGAGCVAKLCNNLALAISMVGIAEGMNLGVKLGVKPEVLAQVFNTSTARCWSSESYNPYPGVMDNVPASRGYTGGFTTNLMEKDLFLALAAARESHSSTPMGALAHQLYALMQTHGSGAKDFSAVMQLIAGDALPKPDGTAGAGASGGSTKPV